MSPSIADLNLSERTASILAGAGVATLDDICSRSRNDLLRLNGFGMRRLAEVVSVLADHGRVLAGETLPTQSQQRVNLTLTRAVYEHAAATGNASKALEDAYRAQHGMPPRPPLAKGGRPRQTEKIDT